MKKIRIFLVNLAKKNKTLRIFFRNTLNLKNKLKYSYYKTKYKTYSINYNIFPNI